VLSPAKQQLHQLIFRPASPPRPRRRTSTPKVCRACRSRFVDLCPGRRFVYAQSTRRDPYPMDRTTALRVVSPATGASLVCLGPAGSVAQRYRVLTKDFALPVPSYPPTCGHGPCQGCRRARFHEASVSSARYWWCAAESTSSASMVAVESSRGARSRTPGGTLAGAARAPRAADPRAGPRGPGRPAPTRGPAEGQPLLILQSQGRTMALSVDEVLGDRELVIRPLPVEIASSPPTRERPRSRAASWSSSCARISSSAPSGGPTRA